MIVKINKVFWKIHNENVDSNNPRGLERIEIMKDFIEMAETKMIMFDEDEFPTIVERLTGFNCEYIGDEFEYFEINI